MQENSPLYPMALNPWHLRQEVIWWTFKILISCKCFKDSNNLDRVPFTSLEETVICSNNTRDKTIYLVSF